jgi:hypothetical protein
MCTPARADAEIGGAHVDPLGRPNGVHRSFEDRHEAVSGAVDEMRTEDPEFHWHTQRV